MKNLLIKVRLLAVYALVPIGMICSSSILLDTYDPPPGMIGECFTPIGESPDKICINMGGKAQWCAKPANPEFTEFDCKDTNYIIPTE